MLDPSQAGNALKDAARVQQVTIHKIVEPLREAEELAEKALHCTDPAQKEALLKQALACVQESGRNLPKATPRTTDYKLEVLFAGDKAGSLDAAKIERLYNLNGRMEEMMERAVERDPEALIEMMASFKMEGKSLSKEVKEVFTLITDMDNIIKNG